MFELGAEHQTHFQMYRLFPSAGAKKHFVVFFFYWLDSSQLRLSRPRQHYTTFEVEEEEDADSEQFVLLNCPSVLQRQTPDGLEKDLHRNSPFIIY